MRAAAAWTNVHQADASLCIPAFVPVLVRVARAMCTAGWPGKTCLSVCGTSLASLSPLDPWHCPEAGRLGGGTSSQGRPQAVSVHYSYRDGMRPAGGWTFTPYLLWSSAPLFFAYIGGCVYKFAWEEEQKKKSEESLDLTAECIFDLPICDRFIEAPLNTCSYIFIHLHKFCIWKKLKCCCSIFLTQTGRLFLVRQPHGTAISGERQTQ